jgi:mRNA interferase RelE/StbE
MSGYNFYYRIRVWDYRMWIRYDNWIIVLERFLHRKDIYNYFPK